MLGWQPGVQISIIYLPNRVSQTDCTTVDINFRRVNAQHLDVGQNHNTESFIDLPQSYIIDFDSSIGQQL